MTYTARGSRGTQRVLGFRGQTLNLICTLFKEWLGINFRTFGGWKPSETLNPYISPYLAHFWLNPFIVGDLVKCGANSAD